MLHVSTIEGQLDAKGLKFALVAGRFNDFITARLIEGAMDALAVGDPWDPATDIGTRTLLGQPAGYWRSIDAVDPVADAAAVALPMLVLQGARDIQVVDADWGRWRGAFHADDKVSFKLYEKLNHLGIAGEGEGSLAEYQQPGHVDATLIDDVAGWIKAH